MYQTIPLDGEVTTYLKVEKVNGTVRFFSVIAGANVEITQREYEEATGEVQV